MSGTIANMLRYRSMTAPGSVTTNPAAPSSGAAGFASPLMPAISLTPSHPSTMTAPEVLNTNRNVIPAAAPSVDTHAAPATVLAPRPAGIPAVDDWRALLKKWWPWILLAVLALAVMLKVGQPSRRRSAE